MRRVLIPVMLLALVLAGCTVRPGPDPTFPPGSSLHTIEIDSSDRSYRLFVPPRIGDDPVPLVVMLHGGFGSAEQAELAYGWDAEAVRRGFIVAYPQGQGRSWNAGGCCGPAMKDGWDDVSFVRAVVAEIAEQHAVDPDRVYATGMSNGGIMAYRLACDTRGIFAAIAPVSATMLTDCDAPDALSVLHIQGALDESIPPDGSPGAGTQNIDGPPLAEVLDFWRDVDRCPEPVTAIVGGDELVTASTSEGCDDDTAVEYIEIGDAGHQWPGAASSEIRDELGGDPPSTRLDATATIADFFAAHTRAANIIGD